MAYQIIYVMPVLHWVIFTWNWSRQYRFIRKWPANIIIYTTNICTNPGADAASLCVLVECHAQSRIEPWQVQREFVEHFLFLSPLHMVIQHGSIICNILLRLSVSVMERARFNWFVHIPKSAATGGASTWFKLVGQLWLTNTLLTD